MEVNELRAEIFNILLAKGVLSIPDGTDKDEIYIAMGFIIGSLIFSSNQASKTSDEALAEDLETIFDSAIYCFYDLKKNFQ